MHATRPFRRTGPTPAALLVAAFALAFLLVPASGAGAEERREPGDGRATETPTPVAAQIATAPPTDVDPDPAPEPPVATVEPETVGGFAAETGDADPGTDPDPQRDNSTCPEDWVQPPAVNDDAGCLLGTATGDASVAAEPESGAVAPDLDFAVQSGSITILVEWCPSALDASVDKFNELLDACQKPDQDASFTLDLGYWSSWQTTGDVIPGGVFWTPPLSPDPFIIKGPNAFTQALFCDDDYDGAGKPKYDEWVDHVDPGLFLGWVLTPEIDAFYCTWFLSEGEGVEPDDEVLVASVGGSETSPEYCEAGWVPAEPPLNPDLGCLPGMVADGTSSGGSDGSSSPAIVAADGSVPAREGIGACPESSAIHPAYREYGCIPYGQGPQAP